METTEEQQEEKKRLAHARHVFKIEEDQEYYGFTERAMDYLKLSVSSYRATLNIKDNAISSDEDFIKIDDTWLKLSKILLDNLRFQFQSDRLESFKKKEVALYMQICVDQMARKKGIITRAGEMICAYLEIDEDQFLYFREGQHTILDSLDPVQFMMPTPESSQVL